MDTNLTLSAQILTLAPNLQHSEAINGLLVVKNVSAISLKFCMWGPKTIGFPKIAGSRMLCPP